MNSNENHSGRASRASALAAFLFVSVGYVFLQMLITPVRLRVLTEIMTKEQYGVTALVIMTVSFLTTVLSLGSFEYMLKNVPGRSNAYQLGLLRVVMKYFGGLSILLAIAVIAGSTIVVDDQTVLRFRDVVLCGLALVLYFHLFQRAYFLLARSDLFRFRVTQFLYSSIWFVPMLIVSLVFPLNMTLILLVWVAWLLLTTVLTWRWVPVRQALTQTNNGTKLNEVLRFGVPLLPMILGEWLFRMGDRYVLLAFCDIKAVADYSLCMNIALIAHLLGANFVGILLPQFNGARNSLSEQELAQPWRSERLRGLLTIMLRYSLVFSLVAGVALLLIGPQVLGVLAAAQFRNAAFILPWAAPVSIFFLTYLVLSRILIALDRSRLVGGLTLAAACLNVMLNILLVPKLQERGAALATCLSLAVLAVGTGLSVRVWLWIDWRKLMPGRMLVAVSASALGILLARHYLHDSNLLVVLSGALWSALWIFGTGLLSKNDLLLVVPSARKG